DAKPGSLWLEPPGGRVKLLDFGLARAVEGDAGPHRPPALTSPGAWVGTPGFMSPEQVNGEPLGPRSDLFSLGCVLYRLATGANPFTGPNRTAVLYATLNHQPPPASALNPGIPDWLSALIARLLAKRPDARLASARAVV